MKGILYVDIHRINQPDTKEAKQILDKLYGEGNYRTEVFDGVKQDPVCACDVRDDPSHLEFTPMMGPSVRGLEQIKLVFG